MLTDRLPTLQSWPVFLAVSGVVLTLLFVLLEPEPSQSLGPGAAVVFWSLHVLVQIAILQAVQSGLSRIWPARWPLPVLQIAAAGLVGAALFSPVAVWVEILLSVAGEDGVPAALTPAALVNEFLNIAPPVTLVWVALNLSRLLRLPLVSGSRADAVDRPAAPGFWDRVPRDLGRDLVALSAELHYLRVYTAKGDALILYPFGRAVADLPETDGVQVHRSHWAARAHMRGLRPRGDGGGLVLSTGLTLPVSRTYRNRVSGMIG